MPQIENYSFGSMTVDQKRYKDDVTIIGETVSGSWWRSQGHFCQESDLEEVFAARPKVLVIGQGSSGMMRVSPGVAARCKKLSISLHAEPTGQAVERFNELALAGKNVAGAFHLTC